MSLTREECEQSLNHLIKGAYSRWYRFHGATAKPHYINQIPVYKGDYKAIQKYQQLIEEHFEHEHTVNFKCFRLLADSILMQWDKEALIDYIHTLYRNWENTDIGYSNVIDYANELLDNSSLNFEELEPDMWMWDNKLKTYFLIKSIKPYSYWNIVIYANYLTDTFEEIHFEENRFYRYEVKE